MCYSVRCDFFYPFSRDLNTAPASTEQNLDKMLPLEFQTRLTQNIASTLYINKKREHYFPQPKR